MAGRINVTIVGQEDVNRALSRLKEGSQREIKTIINTTAINIQTNAKRACVVDTGRLRSSINIIFGNGGYAASIGTNVKYAPYIEFGTGVYAKNGGGRSTPWLYFVRTGKYKGWHKTKGMKPKPFLFPAWEKEKPDFINSIKKYFRGYSP